jgi:probable F420-dependent oxidoreductase
MAIRVGVSAPQQHVDFGDWRDACVAAEEAGVDYISNWDHFYPLSGEPEGKHYESLSMLAALAAITERAEIGPLVLSNTYRNPNLVADMARTIDHISGGRFVLGIGAGWFEKDHDEYGYEFGTPGGRARALGASLPVIKERLARLNPAPLRGIPILIGAKGEKVMLRIVAEHADIWHSSGTPDEIRHKCEVIDNWCRDVGRDPAEIERSVFVDGPIPEQDPDELLAAGATFMITRLAPPYDLGRTRELVAWRDRLNASG